MKTFVALVLVAAALAKPMVLPRGSAPASCSDSHSGSFTISVEDASKSSKRDAEKRQLAGVLTLTLSDGNLKDQAGRTGYIASNYQFQFDAPPQAHARKTTGFSLCSNGSLALSGSAIWYQCLSGDFHNLYDKSWAAQCSPVYLVNRGGVGAGSSVTQGPDGQPAASTVLPPVSQVSDGQPQAPTGKLPAPVSQISDGQPQAPTGTPKSPPVTQISDGQPRVPKTTGAPTAPFSSLPGPVTQISDGQPQAPLSTSSPTANVSVPAGNVTNATATAPAQFTGAAAVAAVVAPGALVAGLAGLMAML